MVLQISMAEETRHEARAASSPQYIEGIRGLKGYLSMRVRERKKGRKRECVMKQADHDCRDRGLLNGCASVLNTQSSRLIWFGSLKIR